MNYIKYLLVTVAVLLFTTNSFAQNVPTPATIDDNNPNNQDILDRLRGLGMTLFFDINNTYGLGADGLISGVRNKQIALFSNGIDANFGIDKGVLFSTGNAVMDLTQRNQNLAISNPSGAGSYNDPDLRGIFNDANQDVVIFKFKVTLEEHTTAIRAVFQFGSEEYPDFVGSMYNDAFGFFVRPADNQSFLPGNVNVINMARLPYSNNPISINTVNFGYAGASGQTSYVGLDLSQSEHYINNGHSTEVASNGNLVTNMNDGPKTVFIEYNGLTKLITYDLKDLTPGGTYEFKIAIADAGDTQYDSGVLLKSVIGTIGADLKIVKEIDNMTPAFEDEVEFTLTASNLGPYDATDATVNDLLPSGYEYVSHDASVGTYDEITGLWDIGFLQAIHQTETLKIRAKIKAIGVYNNIARITSSQLDPDYENNTSSVQPNPIDPCVDEVLFMDDFGVSDNTVNRGRATSLYMPADGYSFATPYPTSLDSDITTIGKGHYAVVAPGYIKSGWIPSDLPGYFWTPGYEEAGAITDVSGSLSGAVMAVNGKDEILPFYQRNVTLENDKVYKLTFWLYVVQNPTQIALDIMDASSGFVFGEVVSETYSQMSDNWTAVELYFKVPSNAVQKCDMTDVVLSLRNNNEVIQGNVYYVDNVGLERLRDESSCYPGDISILECPKSRMIITNPMLLNQLRNN